MAGINILIENKNDCHDGKDKRVCMLCLKERTKYTCPRCNTQYCSVECYRSEKHMTCSENFYKECFMEGLKESDIEPSDKQKMVDMLKRTECDPDLIDLDQSDDDLEGRLAGVDLDGEADKIWSRLTDKEKKEFQSMSLDGRLGILVEVWTPWWDMGQASLVADIGTQPHHTHPEICTNIQNIEQLLKTKPSKDIKYNIIHLLYCYTFVSKLHNGDHIPLAIESSGDMLTLSDVLSHGYSCGSVEEAVQVCLRKLYTGNGGFETTPESNLALLQDVQTIIQHGSMGSITGPLAALSEIHTMLNVAYKHLQKTLKLAKEDDEDMKTKKKTLFGSVKKLEFLLSWCQTYGHSLSLLIPELQLVHKLLISECEAMKKSRQSIESIWAGPVGIKKKTLIEEI
ncbi:zinc finger HIT domain-containing protein 2-like [Dreissena polymorpha]|uniref:HIT-type domain-containing protein n=1 Tax=Dreissena polymorpha TaxID=45954 RepID=A0A9D4H0S6_DREPO|nr:zinc finger HIT domain-containing protein 2-like [Dreissena polymorpha]KAH3827274.1 hypothetical protein DPMN_129205 [Dreissena polymorpha]